MPVAFSFGAAVKRPNFDLLDQLEAQVREREIAAGLTNYQHIVREDLSTRTCGPGADVPLLTADDPVITPPDKDAMIAVQYRALLSANGAFTAQVRNAAPAAWRLPITLESWQGSVATGGFKPINSLGMWYTNTFILAGTVGGAPAEDPLRYSSPYIMLPSAAAGGTLDLRLYNTAANTLTLSNVYVTIDVL